MPCRPPLALALTIASILALGSCRARDPDVCGAHYCLSVGRPLHADGIGRGQGLDVRDGVVWIFGEARTGIIRGFRVTPSGALEPTGEEIALTADGDERASHPTGVTSREPEGTFLGDTVSRKGTLIKIDWAAAVAARTLDGAILAVAADDAAVNGSRPELVKWNGRWVVASSDYGGSGNEVRLYDPALLSTGVSTSTAGVVLARFPVTGYVQSLHYWEARDVLILVQNRRHASGWRLTLVDLAASVQSGTAAVLDVLEPTLPGELEGFHFLDGPNAILVTSASFDNVWPATLTPKRP